MTPLPLVMSSAMIMKMILLLWGDVGFHIPLQDQCTVPLSRPTTTTPPLYHLIFLVVPVTVTRKLWGRQRHSSITWVSRNSPKDEQGRSILLSSHPTNFSSTPLMHDTSSSEMIPPVGLARHSRGGARTIFIETRKGSTM